MLLFFFLCQRSLEEVERDIRAKRAKREAGSDKNGDNPAPLAGSAHEKRGHTMPSAPVAASSAAATTTSATDGGQHAAVQSDSGGVVASTSSASGESGREKPVSGATGSSS